MRSPSALAVLMFFVAWMVAAMGDADGNATSEQPLMPGGGSNTIPSFPVSQQQQQNKKCRLDLSDELFGGVEEACGKGKTVERSRCCPVLAAWLYAAHARTALVEAPPASPPVSSRDLPVHPDDSQACVATLQTSLKTRGINIPRPNATCDAFQCFCGIRLHQLSSLHCPSAFDVNAMKPTSAVRALEANCTDPSHQGCTRCLKTLQKVKGAPGNKEGLSERTRRLYRRDCQLMGLTWLLAKNKTAYIPTVSAVLRAVMYSTDAHSQSECSPDQENMPLAVDSAQLDQSSEAVAARNLAGLLTAFCSAALLLLQFGEFVLGSN